MLLKTRQKIDTLRKKSLTPSLRDSVSIKMSARNVTFNPNNKVSDWFKLNAFADKKINVIEKLKFILGRVENITGKGENAGDWLKETMLVTSIFFFSQNVFKKLPLLYR